MGCSLDQVLLLQISCPQEYPQGIGHFTLSPKNEARRTPISMINFFMIFGFKGFLIADLFPFHHPKTKSLKNG